MITPLDRPFPPGILLEWYTHSVNMCISTSCGGKKNLTAQVSPLSRPPLEVWDDDQLTNRTGIWERNGKELWHPSQEEGKGATRESPENEMKATSHDLRKNL